MTIKVEESPKVVLDQPVRFLALAWHESHWEFDHPTLLLEPVLRYSPNGIHCESMVEDAIIDLSLALEYGDPIRDETDLDREFEWRGWNLRRLRAIAEKLRQGREVRLDAEYRIFERTVVFRKQADGEVTIEDVIEEN